MKEFVFRMAETKDAQAIYEIEMKTFAKPWSLAAIMEAVKIPHMRYAVKR